MEGKKTDFVENNPYLVYSPDAEVSYTGGDSPTPPEPPAPVGNAPFYFANMSPEELTSFDIFKFTSLDPDADPEEITPTLVYSNEYVQYYRCELPVGSFIAVGINNASVLDIVTSDWYYQENGTPMPCSKDGGIGGNPMLYWTVIPDMPFTEPTQADFENQDDFSWSDWACAKVEAQATH